MIYWTILLVIIFLRFKIGASFGQEEIRKKTKSDSNTYMDIYINRLNAA